MRTWLSVGTIGAALCLALTISSAPARGEVGQAVCVTYRCSPSERPRVFERMKRSVLPRLWQRLGADSSVRVRLYVTAAAGSIGPWDALLVVRFGSAAGLAAWFALERETPAGLMPEEHRGIEEIHTVWAAMPVEREAPLDDRSLVLVRPYSYTDTAFYPDFVRAYLVPQLDAWRQAGALAGYSVLINRFPGGRAWDILLLQHYHDAAALGRREEVRGAAVDSLRHDPAWRLLHEYKGMFRTSNNPENIPLITQPVLIDHRKEPSE